MIPSSSQVLIIDVNPGSLILGVALAKSGIEVLITDTNNQSDLKDTEFLFDNYGQAFLKNIGFEAEHKIDAKQLEKQALQLLANSLCNILWNTSAKDIEAFPGKFTLTLQATGEKTIHHTSLIIQQKDLKTGLSFLVDFKNVILLNWKIQGYINGVLNAKALNEHRAEKEILINYYTGGVLSQSVFKKILRSVLNFQKQDFNLRESRINLHLSQYSNIRAGDLLPDLKVYDEKRKIETSFYEWCRLGEFSLLMLGEIPSYNLINNANWIKSHYKLNIFYLPPTEKNSSIFQFFKINIGETKALIVRPDRYICFINDRIELEIIENYLNNVLFMIPNKKAFNLKELTEGKIENYP